MAATAIPQRRLGAWSLRHPPLAASGERLMDYIINGTMILALGSMVVMSVWAVGEMLRERRRRRVGR